MYFFSLQREDFIYLREQICELIPTLSPDYIYKEFEVNQFNKKIRAKGGLYSTFENLKKHLKKARLIECEKECNDSYIEEIVEEQSGKN